MVGGIAIAMFVALVGFGGKYFGWSDPDGKVQLALVTAFILGIIVFIFSMFAGPLAAANMGAGPGPYGRRWGGRLWRPVFRRRVGRRRKFGR